MKRLKEWWKENWENRSFRYGIIIVVLIIAAVAVSIYADIRDSREQVDNAAADTSAVV
ncbi:MAG: hypothetical protein ACI4KF_11050 [Huintestinicola sp.]